MDEDEYAEQALITKISVLISVLISDRSAAKKEINYAKW